ncbi:MAG: PKD domain-containing protein [Candidatus Micrarchaeota archaeon]|nr:PKD domain-containing protein [Candidatus Micrarchaeota archaeon]
MVQKGIIGIFALLMLLGTPMAQGTALPSNIQNPLATVQQWLPILAIAIFLSISFAAILYMLGKILNDPQISARGLSELGQGIGTAIFAVLAVGVLLFFGTFISGSTLFTGGFSTDISNICAGFSSPQVQLALVQQNPTTLMCTIVKGTNGGGVDATPYLNYGLASSYVIIANLTNQAANNINSLYVYEGFVGFLSTLVSDPGFCEPAPSCTIPVVQRLFSVDVSSKPLAGYSLISSMTRPVESQAVFIFYMLLTQMVVFIILINIWPYLLAAGILLRALPFTRSAGGLLMGLTLVIVIILPLVTMIEYGALAHGVTTSQLAGNAAQIQDHMLFGLKSTGSTFNIAWGDGTSDTKTLSHTYQTAGTYSVVATVTDSNGGQTTASQQIVLPPVQQYQPPASPKPALYMSNPAISGLSVSVCPTGTAGICTPYDSLLPNFYVFPSLQQIINYNDCWPQDGNLGLEEASDSLIMATQLGVGTGLEFGGFVQQIPDLKGAGIKCSPPEAIASTLQLMDVYGMMSVVGFIIPLFNILIIISAIKNMSYLFGGDTDIAGLGKLV